MLMTTAREAKNNFGTMIDSAHSAPVIITKHNRPSVVVLDIDVYEHFQSQIEDYFLARQADRVLREGDFLGVDESKKFMKDLVNEKS